MTDPTRGPLIAKLKNLSAEFARTVAELEAVDAAPTGKVTDFICLLDDSSTMCKILPPDHGEQHEQSDLRRAERAVGMLREMNQDGINQHDYGPRNRNTPLFDELHRDAVETLREMNKMRPHRYEVHQHYWSGGDGPQDGTHSFLDALQRVEEHARADMPQTFVFLTNGKRVNRPDTSVAAAAALLKKYPKMRFEIVVVAPLVGHTVSYVVKALNKEFGDRLGYSRMYSYSETSAAMTFIVGKDVDRSLTMRREGPSP